MLYNQVRPMLESIAEKRHLAISQSSVRCSMVLRNRDRIPLVVALRVGGEEFDRGEALG